MLVNRIKPAPKNAGFSLVELVAAIVLISILAVTVLPKFTSRGGFTEYAARDEIKSAIQFAQQRAMYDHSGSCYSFAWDSAAFAPRRDGVDIARYAGSGNNITLDGDYADITLSPASAVIYFDGLGNTFTGGCNGTPISTFDITVTDAATLTLRVHGTGYVQLL